MPWRVTLVLLLLLMGCHPVRSFGPTLEVPLRLLWPLSGGRVHPSEAGFRWTGGTGPYVLQFCAETACSEPLESLSLDGGSSGTRVLPETANWWRVCDTRRCTLSRRFVRGPLAPVERFVHRDFGRAWYRPEPAEGGEVDVLGSTRFFDSNGDRVISDGLRLAPLGSGRERRFGWSPPELVSLGDVNGDGSDDFVFAPRPTRCTDELKSREVYLSTATGYDRSTRAERWPVVPCSVTPVGDLDDSGYDDFLMRNPAGELVLAMDLGGPSQAFVTLGFRTEPGAWIGGSVTTGLDLNGDGIADSVVYMGLRVILFGSLDRRFTYANAWTREFGDIVALADLDGDGITEFAGSAEGGPGEPSYQKVCSGRFLLGDRFARCVPVGSRNAAWLAPLLGLPGGRAVVFVESELDNEFHSMAQPCEITGWTVRCLRPVRWLSVNHGDGDHLLGCHAGVITDQCEGHSPESIRPDRWW